MNINHQRAFQDRLPEILENHQEQIDSLTNAIKNLFEAVKLLQSAVYTMRGEVND